jgi:protein-S-isoprenylcysteine O-methyltransferase Ste14
MRSFPDAAPPSQRSFVLLDRGEQVVVFALFVWLCWRVVESSNPFAPLVLVGEALVLAFVLLRRTSSAISMRGDDWAVAFGATLLPLLFDPSVGGPSPLAAASVVMFGFGTIWQVWAKLYLRRSFGIIPANRGVKMGGPYKAMRHPMYFGYFIVQVSLLFVMFSTWNLALYGAAWLLQIVRLKREEDLLMQDPAYRAYAETVRYRVIPGVF